MSSMIWASSLVSADVVTGNYTATPNSAEPPAAKQVRVSESFARDKAMRLTLAAIGPATAAVTVTVWVYDASAAQWVSWATSVVATVGVVNQATVVPPCAKCYIQLTAIANAPTGFAVGFIPN